ncbi:hypothetical protein FJ976_27855 [Mesorhizobium sp. B1-1-9]|nr:hypothetical protein FJ976_27855 [Mesorhizobium sp. B1-1-9]TPN44647.1 hypothetical protein FJ978_28925 [Mesorhizobium sp. B1-1-7]
MGCGGAERTGVAKVAPYGAPLCPAGHLPLKWGDRMLHRLSPIAYVASNEPAPKPPISPLEGEMSGRTEGGAKELNRI